MLPTKRMLPPSHPLFILLKPHFEGTAFINNAANKSLINPGGAVAQMASQEIHELNDFIGDQVLAQLGKDLSFPALLKDRKMDKENFKVFLFYFHFKSFVFNLLKKLYV